MSIFLAIRQELTQLITRILSLHVFQTLFSSHILSGPPYFTSSLPRLFSTNLLALILSHSLARATVIPSNPPTAAAGSGPAAAGAAVAVAGSGDGPAGTGHADGGTASRRP